MVGIIKTLPAAIYCPYIPKTSVILAEAKIHGAKYYTVRPVFFDWMILENWAIGMFGNPSDMWDSNCGRWYMNDSKFWFRKESDRTMFVLRWS